MLTRRAFGRVAASAVVVRGLPGWAVDPETAEVDSENVDNRFSVMMWTLKKLGSFEENLERVAHAGYRHVELVGEFFQWTEAERARLMTRMRGLGISVDATSGMKLGFADPAGGQAYVAELKGLVKAAQGVECRRLILLSGKKVAGATDEAQRAAAVETLKRVADALEPAGMDAVIEPIDRLENPTIWMDGVEEAFGLASAVGSARIKVLYDLYHEQRTKGNLIEKLEKNIGAVGLIHVADVPGRHEPGTGEVNHWNIYHKLGELRYQGMIAMEFYPTGDVVETLRKARTEAASALSLR
jgi:hydroxypyruvate isomerase